MDKESQCIKKWQEESHDEMDIIVPKSDKERTKIYNESIESFILRAIEETMELDKKMINLF